MRDENINLKKVKNHVRKYHKLNNVDQLYPTKVNSYHNFSISKLGKNFKIVSKSDDEEIEAIKHINYKWLGWMWHPERETPYSEHDLNFFTNIFSND